MKSIVNRVVVLLVIGALTSVLALSKTMEKKVKFNKDVSVNGTLVKQGTYKVTFNDETGELTIKQGGRIVATAPARLEKTDIRYGFYSDLRSDDPTNPPALVSISFKGGNMATIVNGKVTSSRQ